VERLESLKAGSDLQTLHSGLEQCRTIIQVEQLETAGTVGARVLSPRSGMDEIYRLRGISRSQVNTCKTNLIMLVCGKRIIVMDFVSRIDPVV